MAAFEFLLFDKSADTGVARITLNRPERLNALHRPLAVELVQALEDAAGDDDMRVLVLAGAGRAFCSGADTGAMVGGRERGEHSGDRGSEELRRGFRMAQRIILGLQRMEKPTIAMVNGPAVGAGLDLACACDMRTGSPNARFMAGYVRLGLFPGYGGTWLYPRLVGSLGRAAEMIFTGDFVEAEEAYRFGLLNHLVPAEELEAFTMDLARRIAQGPPIALRLAKQLLYKGLEVDLETAMQMAAAAETVTLTSQDHQEGVAALREKRPARFRGQ
ncbi:MAG: enoyl-CoA hydratase/isomerase family protein [Chloroflexi bacterium]|nr:enoyl-CoA hydratase/isomerase family protein [Chloroflexota bacterium]